MKFRTRETHTYIEYRDLRLKERPNADMKLKLAANL